MKTHIHIMLIVFAGILSFGCCAFCDTMTQGPIPFSNTNAAPYQQFTVQSGYLHAVTLVVTNFNISQDIIWDNDSTGTVSFSRVFTQQWPLATAFPKGHGTIYGTAFTIETNMAGLISYPDDGDGSTNRNGGNDEIVFSIAHSNLTGKATSTKPYVFVGNTGLTNLSLWFATLSSSSGGLDPVEMYVTNQQYSGNLFVHYEYSTQCLTPDLKDISQSNSTIQLRIDNLSVGSSNSIQRCFDLQSNDWTNVNLFVSGNWSTNWTEQISNEWDSVFYRILSK
jgi:hypothetical protein